MYVSYLFNSLTDNRNRKIKIRRNDFLPVIQHSLKPINIKNIDFNTIGCLNKNNSNYFAKLEIFKNDIHELYQILDNIDLKELKPKLHALWTKKASYVSDQIEIRFHEIYTQLYNDKENNEQQYSTKYE